jgi:uncharacterized protein YndB with AHSA1/START domain
MILASICASLQARQQERGQAMSGTDVKTITVAVEIARNPREVFDYIADASHLPEWQPDVRRAGYDEPAAVSVGSLGREVRHVMGSDRSIAWEVTNYNPDHRYGVRGVNGPVRAHVTMDLTPTTDGTGTRLEYGIVFEGHGIGKLLAPLARKDASKDLGATLERLKRRLEESPSAARRVSQADG